MKTKRVTSIPFSILSDDQVQGLYEVNQFENSKGLLMLNFRWINHKKGRTFAININEWLRLESLLKRKKKQLGINNKSVPIDYIMNNFIELPRYKSGWDLLLLM